MSGKSYFLLKQSTAYIYKWKETKQIFMMYPKKEDLKRRFAKHRETPEYRTEFNRLMDLEFQDFMQEFMDFHQRVTEDMEEETGNNNPTVEEREWYYLYYGGELYSDVIKAHGWGRIVDMALELIDKETRPENE